MLIVAFLLVTESSKMINSNDGIREPRPSGQIDKGETSGDSQYMEGIVERLCACAGDANV